MVLAVLPAPWSRWLLVARCCVAGGRRVDGAGCSPCSVVALAVMPAPRPLGVPVMTYGRSINYPDAVFSPLIGDELAPQDVVQRLWRSERPVEVGHLRRLVHRASAHPPHDRVLRDDRLD